MDCFVAYLIPRYFKMDQDSIINMNCNKLCSSFQQCANIGPADYNYDETISTLRFANRVKNIQNKARINEDLKDALLRHLQKEIKDLQKKLEECKKPIIKHDKSLKH